jgi:hypothetical protein
VVRQSARSPLRSRSRASEGEARQSADSSWRLGFGGEEEQKEGEEEEQEQERGRQEKEWAGEVVSNGDSDAAAGEVGRPYEEEPDPWAGEPAAWAGEAAAWSEGERQEVEVEDEEREADAWSEGEQQQQQEVEDERQPEEEEVAVSKGRRSKKGWAGSKVTTAARRWKGMSRRQSSDEEKGLWGEGRGGRREEAEWQEEEAEREEEERGKTAWGRMAEVPQFVAQPRSPRKSRWKGVNDQKLLAAVEETGGDLEKVRERYFPGWSTAQLKRRWTDLSKARFGTGNDEQIMRAIAMLGSDSVEWARRGLPKRRKSLEYEARYLRLSADPVRALALARDVLVEFRAQHPTEPLPPPGRVPLAAELVGDYLAGLRETDGLEWSKEQNDVLERRVRFYGFHWTDFALEFNCEPLDVCKHWEKLHPGLLTSFGL